VGLVGIAVIVVLGVAAVSVLHRVFRPLQVVYRIEGSSDRADLTITTPESITQPAHTEPLPASDLPVRIRQEFHRGDHLYVWARNDAAGTLRCSIIINGRTVVDDEVSGTGAIATCSAIA